MKNIVNKGVNAQKTSSVFQPATLTYPALFYKHLIKNVKLYKKNRNK